MNAEKSFQAGQPKTFSNQDKISRLPVPRLESTLARYLDSLVPFIQQDALAQTTAEPADQAGYIAKELEARRDLIRDFLKPGGLGETLQNRLIDLDRSQDSPNNWLDDSLWRPKAYGEWRAPLVVNSNWQLSFRDDPSIPRELLPKEYNTAFVNYKSSPSKSVFSLDERTTTDTLESDQSSGVLKNALDAVTGSAARPAPFSKRHKVFSEANGASFASGHTDFQIKRAAHLTWRLLSFKLRLDKEEILPDVSRAGPFDMHQYTQLYGVTRIPSWGCDKLVRNEDKSVGRHISVLVGGRVWEAQIVNDDGTSRSVAEIEGALREIVQDAQSQWSEAVVDVGILTADHRDFWTKARENLLRTTGNRQVLASLENSLFLVALDHYASGDGQDLSAHLRNMLSGNEGRNRWFDKAMSIIVESNGRAGINGEHSPCDALIPSIVIEYVLAQDVDTSIQPVPSSQSGLVVRQLHWTTDASVAADVQGALERIKPIIDDSDPYILYYSDYGVDFVKKVAKQAPDAYMQMALQLAFYKMHGKGVATYETASTRAFKHGRTDVIRSFSKEAFAFVRGMSQSEPAALSAVEKFNLLTAATKSHFEQTKTSSSGMGIDRHLLVLRLLLQGEESHPIFSDPLFATSQRWTLSTSGLSAGDRFNGTNFGAAYPDGYGINYLAGAHLLKFGIESKRSNRETDTVLFARKVAEALDEMREIALQGQAQRQPNGSTIEAKL